MFVEASKTEGDRLCSLCRRRTCVHCIKFEEAAPPLRVSVEIDKQVVDMEVDTGAACSLMSEVSFRELWPSCKLSKVDHHLRTYLGEPILVLGTVTVNIKYKDQVYQEPLLVVKGDVPDLFGRNRLDHIRLDWQEIKYLQQSPLQTMLKRHEAVFHGGLGALRGYQATIVVDPNARPCFWKAQSVPYAYRGLVEEELNHLVQEEPVEMSDWASLIVPVLKSDGKSVCVCVETLNRWLIQSVNLTVIRYQRLKTCLQP